MRKRMFGLETEYALCFYPAAESSRPTNYQIFKALKQAIGDVVKIAPGEISLVGQKFFVENGSCFYYDLPPNNMEDGVLEWSTPECDSAAELVRYERSQEQLLTQVRPQALRLLEQQGFFGELKIFKNCRDTEGNVYGAQENYEANIAEGVGLWLYRVAVSILLVPLFICYLLLLLIVAPVIIIELMIMIKNNPDFVSKEVERNEFFGLFRKLRFSSKVTTRLEQILMSPFTLPMNALYKLLVFRRLRRALTGFMVSRAVITGAGSLYDNEHYSLSEKAASINVLMRGLMRDSDHPLFDTRNLYRMYLTPLVSKQFYLLKHLYSQRQRFQMSYSDSNRCELASFLKFGTTVLIVEMAEQGWLQDAPMPKHPIAALHSLALDSDLQQSIELRDGSRMTALQLQEYYLAQTKAYLNQCSIVSVEKRDIVQLWQRMLEYLKNDPARALGSLDWVTKRLLIEKNQTTDGKALDADARKKIDLKYHELGDGYFELIKTRDWLERLVDEDSVQSAVFEPPNTRAAVRSRLLKQILESNKELVVSWEQIRVKSASSKKDNIISLDDYRENP